MKTRVLLLGMLLLAAPALAGDVDGKWAGMISTPGGDFPVAYEFKSDGPTLTGTANAPDGSNVAIKDGKIDGNKITFGVSLDIGGMPLDIAYVGVVSPEEIKMTAEVLGMPLEFVVKKAK